MTERHASRDERAEMFRAHIGLVTALSDDDQDAITAQLKEMILDAATASNGDIGAFAGRMAKQAEAGARVTRHVILDFAQALGITEAELITRLATQYSGTDIADAMEE